MPSPTPADVARFGRSIGRIYKENHNMYMKIIAAAVQVALEVARDIIVEIATKGPGPQGK